MHKVINYLVKEIDNLEDKISRTGEISKSELECGDMQAHFLKSLLTCEAMMDGGYSRENGGNNGYSNARQRDSMGRYMDSDPSYGGSYARYNDDRSMDNGYSGRRYSRDEGKANMISQLQGLMADAPSADEREVLQKALQQLKSM